MALSYCKRCLSYWTNGQQLKHIRSTLSSKIRKFTNTFFTDEWSQILQGFMHTLKELS